MARVAPNTLPGFTVLPLDPVATSEDQQQTMDYQINYVGRHVTPMVVSQSLHEQHTDADFWFIREVAASEVLKRTWRIPASQYGWSPDKLRVHVWARATGDGGIVTAAISAPAASNTANVVASAAWTLYTIDITLPTPTNAYYDLDLSLEVNTEGYEIDVTSIYAYYLPANSLTPDEEDQGVVYLDEDRTEADEPLPVLRHKRRADNLDLLLTTRLSTLVTYAGDATWTANGDGPMGLPSGSAYVDGSEGLRVVDRLPIRIGPRVNNLKIWLRAYGAIASASKFRVRVWTRKTGYEAGAGFEINSTGGGAAPWGGVDLPYPQTDEIVMDELFVEIYRGSGALLRNLSVWEEVV